MILDGKKRIYLITDGGRLRARGQLCQTVETALDQARGTIGWVQLREQLPSNDVSGPFVATDAEVTDLASHLAPICAQYGATLLINRRPDLAKSIPGVGVHLSRLGAYIETARDILGYDRLIGYSSHSIGEALEASARGVDYVSISPIFATRPKNTIGPPILSQPLGVDIITELSAQVSIPLFALGGIDADNFFECFNKGASGIALSSSIFLSDDVGASARLLAERVLSRFQ